MTDKAPLPDMSNLPKIPDMPNMPDMPKNMKMPDMPKDMKMPDMPQMPKMPDAEKIAENIAEIADSERAQTSGKIFLVIGFMYILYIIYFLTREYREPFTSSYSSCTSQGYNNDFCLRVPFDSCLNCDKELKDKFIPKQFYTFSS